MGIDPRIDLVNRSGVHRDETIQDGYVTTALKVRGHMVRRYGYRIRTTDHEGKPLARPEKEPVEESLPVVRADADRRRIGFACVGPDLISFARDLAGIYRTPFSPRDHPNVLADYRAVRARIERQNGVLRQF